VIALSLLAACRAPSAPSDRPAPEPEDETGTAIVVDTATGATAATGDTAPPEDTAVEPAAVDCSLLVPAADIAPAVAIQLTTEEDFDFDGQGWLLTQRVFTLEGMDRAGDAHLVAPLGVDDPAGIRSTPNGDIVVADPWDGVLRRVDAATGGWVDILGGLDNPNGVEAGADGQVYVTELAREGRVRRVDPLTGAFEILADGVGWPNGIVLSHDEQTLYFTSSGALGGETRIMAIGRGADGSWDPTTTAVAYTHPTYVNSLTIDACENLYALEYVEGRVIRIDTTTWVVEELLQFPEFAEYSALHFSPGLGGWDLTALYATSRNQVYEIPVGVPGSHVLTP
jgi:sugar lactone lactonase YvrE